MMECADGVDVSVPGDEMLRMLAALANPHRLRVIAALAGGRNYVSQLARQLEMSRPLLHMHLQRLEAAGYEPVIQTLRDLAMPGLLLSGSPDEGPLLGTLKPVPAIPGRGRLLTRDRGLLKRRALWAGGYVRGARPATDPPGRSLGAAGYRARQPAERRSQPRE